MSGGSKGGGSSGTNSNDVMLEQQRRSDEANAKAAEERRAADELAQQAALFATNYRTAEDAAKARYTDSLSRRGIAGDDLNYILANAIGAGNRAVPNDTSALGRFDTNVNAYFTDDLLANAIANAESERRQQYTTTARNAFAPGRENNIFTYTMDDPYIESVLADQRTDAQSMLDRARARGNLDQSGYDAGLARLEALTKSGRAEADRIGNSIIDTNRQALRNIGNTAISDAGSYTLGGNWSMDPYNTDWLDTRRRLTGSLEGDVRSALEGQEFFDLTDLLTQAGIKQGAQNPTQSNADAVAARQAIRDSNRGIGGTGTF